MDSIDSSDESEKDSWIDRFLSLDGHEFLCEVDTEFIQDSFNLYGLKDKMGNTKFKHALKTILDHYDTTASDSDDPDFNHARELYGLIHQRFILTRRGLDKMFRKYRQGDFGMCPVTSCNDTKMLPVGLFDNANHSSVKLFCPCCKNSFHPSRCLDQHHRASSSMDGAFFGTTFAHLLMLTFRDSFSNMEGDKYVPKIFGFKIHKSAYGDNSDDEKDYKKNFSKKSKNKHSSSSSKKMNSKKSSSSSSSRNKNNAVSTANSTTNNNKTGNANGKTSSSSARKSTSPKLKMEESNVQRLQTENMNLKEKLILLQQQMTNNNHHAKDRSNRNKTRSTEQELNSATLQQQVEPSAILESRMKRKKYSATSNSRKSTSSSASSKSSKRQKHREGR